MYEKAASKGDDNATYKLGEMYYNGEGVSKKMEESIKLFEKSANRGHADSRVKLIEIYEKLANTGFGDAEYKLGEIYYEGEWLEQNVDKAIKLFERSAKQGHEESRKKIIEIYLSQSDKGNIQADCRLGDIYYKGELVGKNIDEAIKWYEKAVKQGSIEAKTKLGEIYYKLGEKYLSLNENVAEAIRWFEKSIEQEYADAQYRLGEMYRKGIYVTKNEEKAMELYEMASKQGHIRAKTRVRGNELFSKFWNA